MSHLLPEPDYTSWWAGLDPATRRELTRHAYTALPDHLAETLLAERTEVDLIVADRFGVDTRWYLSRDTAAFVASLTVQRHLA